MGKYLTTAEHRVLEHACALTAGPSDALEIGSEGGRWSSLLDTAGWSVTCTDVDPEALAVCRRRIPRARCIPVKPEDEGIPCASGSVRLLLAYEVAPVTQNAWFPPEAARVLEPGGVLVCTYYNPSSIRGLVYRALCRANQRRRVRPSNYYRGRPYRSFRTSLEQLGFKTMYEEGLCWFPFRRQSNSPLIPACTKAEAVLGLRSHPTVSPFVLLIARRE